MSETYQSQPISYNRLPSQGMIAGLTVSGFIGVLAAALSFITILVSKGILQAFLTLPATVPLALLSIKKIGGEAILTHLLREVGGNVRKRVGATKYRARPEKKKIEPEAALDIPGRQGRLFLYETDTGAAVVWDAANEIATITCVVATLGMGQPQVGVPSTVDDEERDYMINEWAKVLGSFTQREHIVRVTTLEMTRPGTIAAEKRYFDELPHTDSASHESYLSALEQVREQVVLHRTQLAISFKISGQAKEHVKGYGGGKAGLLGLAGLEMQTITDALDQALFTRVAWLTAREWGAWGRSIIDPAMQAAVDVRIGTEHQGVDPHAAVPMFVDEHRNFVETDSGWHRTYWISEWPRYQTYPGFLSRLVLNKPASGVPVRHSFMLVASPVPIGAAMKRLAEDKRTWITNQRIRAKADRLDSAADDADWHAILQHEQDLVHGQGELRFSAFITVTATAKETLEQECASLLNACSATGLETRMMPWQQSEALMNVAYPCGEGMK